MSLQVDLQLSLLNISSSSKIQRLVDKPLQPETIKTLKEAKEAVEAAKFLPKYSESPEPEPFISPRSITKPQSNSNQYRGAAELESMSTSVSAHAASGSIKSNTPTLSHVFNIAQGFVVLPSTAEMASSQATEQDNPTLTIRNAISEVEQKSIKSSSSTESFKSAISLQEANINIARQVKAVQAVTHSFRTALHILHSLIERRMPEKGGQVYVAAKDLQDSLYDRSKEIDGKHIANFKKYGQVYIERFTSKVSAKLQDISLTIMREVVMRLHVYSAEHEDLLESGFEALCKCSENCSRQILVYLERLVPSQKGLFDHELLVELPAATDEHPIPSPGTGRRFQGWDLNIGEKPAVPQPPTLEVSGKRIAKSDSSSDERPALHHFCCLENNGPELSLPFIGYTFKRFDNSIANRDTIPPSTSTPIHSVPQTEPFVLPNLPPHSPTTQARVSQDYPVFNPILQDSEFQTFNRGAVEPNPDSKLDVLQDFDFDSFLHQNEDASGFGVPINAGLPGAPYSRNQRHGKAYNGQTTISPPEEEPPVYVNAKQFHRILRRRAARQSLEDESPARKPEAVHSDALNEQPRNNETIDSAAQAFGSVASPISTLPGSRTQSEKGLAPLQVSAFSASSGSYTIPADVHRASRLPVERRARSPAASASARFRERRRQKDKEAMERGANRNGEKLPGPPMGVPLSSSPSQCATQLLSSELHPIATSTGPYNVPVDVITSSRSFDEKRARNAGASARFRARRKEREREATEREAREEGKEAKRSIERLSAPSDEASSMIGKTDSEFHGIVMSASPYRRVLGYARTGPHQTFAASPSGDKPKRNLLPPLAINSFTGLPPTISVCPPPPTQHASSRPDVCLSLSLSQDSKLWWRSFASTLRSNFPAFEVPRFEFSTELGFLTNFPLDDEKICKQISSDIERLGRRNHHHRHQAEDLNEILEIRSNVLRIMSTIDEQLGLQVATFGWSCVCIFLHVYERILEKNFIPPEAIDWTNKAFPQFQDIVATIARYAVMENLYQQSGGALSLESDYQSALLSLCSKILEYFAVSLTLGRAMSGDDHTTGQKQAFVDACEQLMETIREKDRICQGFQVVVEAKEESESEPEAEIEDVSDDSWEEVRVPSSEDGLIDLDTAIV